MTWARRVEVVLEPGGGLPQPRPELAAGGLGAEQVLAQLALLVPGEPREVGIRRAPLHHGEGLEHAVVERPRHLLARLHHRDLALGLAQLHRRVPGRAPGQRVEDQRRGQRDRGPGGRRPSLPS